MSSLLEAIIKDPSDFDPDLITILKNPRNYTAVLAEEPARFFFEESDKEFWNQKEEFRNLAPPFDIMWIEFNRPKYIKSNVHGITPWPAEGFNKAGVLLLNIPKEESSAADKFPTAKWLIQACVFTEGEANQENLVRGLGFQGKVINLVNYTYGVEADGSLSAINGDSVNCFDIFFDFRLDRQLHKTYTHEQCEKILRHISEISFPILNVAMLSTYLMHASGTDLTPKKTSQVLAKSKKKKGKEVIPDLRFKILDLGLEMRRSMDQAKSEGLGLSRALHLRRGHFKHYTKPMFGTGKTGDVWVRPHKAGGREHGEIINKYKPPKVEDKRNNPDSDLRSLERQWKTTGSWDAKLAYNLACVRAGIIPPPDFEFTRAWANWDIQSLEEYYSHTHISWEWTPEVGTTKSITRKWFFPNNAGVSWLYRMDDPLPGLAPVPMFIPVGRHQVETINFTYDTKTKALVPTMANYARLGTIVIQPAIPLPGLSFLHRSVRRELLSDTDALLKTLQEVAASGADTPGTDYYEDPRQYPIENYYDVNLRRNPDEPYRKSLNAYNKSGDVAEKIKTIADKLRFGLIDEKRVAYAAELGDPASKLIIGGPARHPTKNDGSEIVNRLLGSEMGVILWYLTNQKVNLNSLGALTYKQRQIVYGRFEEDIHYSADDFSDYHGMSIWYFWHGKGVFAWVEFLEKITSYTSQDIEYSEPMSDSEFQLFFNNLLIDYRKEVIKLLLNES